MSRDDENAFDFGFNVIEIFSENHFVDDEIPPIVSDVTLDKQKVLLNEEFKVCAKVTDDSEIKYVSVDIHLNEDDGIMSKDMIYDAVSGLYCQTFKSSKTGTAIISNIYVIDIYDINEEPPKVSIKVSSTEKGTSEIVDFDLVNKVDAILETKY